DLAQLVDGLGVEAFGGDGLHDVCLDNFQSDGWGQAEAPLLGGADVVLVDAAVAGGLTVEQAATPTGLEALAAEHDALEVVEVPDVAVALAVALVEDMLHLKECLLGEGLLHE